MKKFKERELAEKQKTLAQMESVDVALFMESLKSIRKVFEHE